MAGDHVTHSQLKEHLEPINTDLKNLIAEVSKSSASTMFLAESVKEMALDMEPRIRDLEKHSTVSKTYWKLTGTAIVLICGGLASLAVAVLS